MTSDKPTKARLAWEAVGHLLDKFVSGMFTGAGFTVGVILLLRYLGLPS